jgi:hypothetical protein
MIGVLIVRVTAGTGQLAGATVEHPTTISTSAAPFALSASALTTGQLDQSLFAPTFKKRFYANGVTGMTVVNPDQSLSATVDITFTVANIVPGSAADTAGVSPGDTYVIDDLAIPASADRTISAFNIQSVYGVAMEDGILASVQIVSDLPVAGVMNETNSTFTVGGSASGKAAYTLFPVGQATTEISLPLVKEDFFNKTTGVTFVNVGDGPTTLTATYVSGASSYTLVKTNLAAGESIAAFRCAQGIGGQCSRFDAASTFLNNAAAVSKRYGVSVTSSSQPVIALSQESSLIGSLDLGNYEGFAVEP